ncbi:MAG: hypothetical protein K1X35_06805 [Caulobacteraceae bacterium]|nr:hypothetical protein [Caulobacteraceae bacterium]
MRGFFPRLAFATAAIGLTAALSVQPPAATAETERDCFNVNSVSGFQADDDDVIYVRVGASRTYQLEVLGSCPNVDWTQHLGLETRGSSFVCTGMDVDLIVPQDGMGPPLRCAVKAVRRLTDAERDALKQRNRH